jgi:hypothetical protein
MPATSTGPDKPSPVAWRFSKGNDDPPLLVVPASPLAGVQRLEALDLAWLRLLVLHTPSVPPDVQLYPGLVDRYRDLETLFLRDSDLEPYYEEAFRPFGAMSEETALQPVVGPAPRWKLNHVAAIQAQLMEDVFYAFRLDRHANSSENRGWMNLFRRWGNSKGFQVRFEAIAETFSIEFVDFYEHYIKDRPPIDEAPVPHPWDPARVTARIARERAMPGVYLDSGIREAHPRKVQAPIVGSGAPGAGPAKAENEPRVQSDSDAEGGTDVQSRPNE